MPTRNTHIVFAILLFVILQVTMQLPWALALFAAVGALLPDIDLRFMHRKLLHNVWALIAVAWGGMAVSLFTYQQAIALSIGWASHLIADSLTHRGIMPLWPIVWPKFKGIITTGGKSEWILMGVLLLALGFVTGFVRL
jgi:inner membrane protein